MTGQWRNWGRTEHCTPVQLLLPASTGEVVEAVNLAREQGLSVRPVGAGHSFSGIAATNGVQLSLAALRGIVSVDLSQGHVTFGAGTYLWEIASLLRPFSLALENMGDIDRQTLAGAISTGTHGTGAQFGSLSSMVVGVTGVGGTGETFTVDAHENSDWLPGVALSLGALGVLLTVTLRCVPSFALHAVEAAHPLGSILREYEQYVSSHDHFEFYWFPHTDIARVKTHRRELLSEATLRPLSPVAEWIDAELANNVIFGALVAAERMFPRLTPAANRAISQVSSHRTYSDVSSRVFVSPRRVRFREMEYAVPRAAVPDILQDLRQAIDRNRCTVSFPVEVRAAAGDGLWLSPTRARDVGYVAVHRYWRDRDVEYFRAAEDIFRAYGGLPHWGKMHSVAAREYAAELPGFRSFLALRDTLDPDRVMRNSYLDRVLGA